MGEIHSKPQEAEEWSEEDDDGHGAQHFGGLDEIAGLEPNRYAPQAYPRPVSSSR
jgi:hypothetical protein